MKPRAGGWVKVRSKEEILRTLDKECGTNRILQPVVRKGLAGHFAPDLSAKPVPVRDIMPPDEARRRIADDREVLIAGLGVGGAPSAGAPSKVISL
jgi:hypothetical protein